MPSLPPPAVSFHCTEGPDAMALAPARALLSGPEQERAARFHFPRDRDRWICGRAWIRRELATFLRQRPESVQIGAEPGGRLYLPDFPRCCFNLSHTGDWIALVICQEGRIGVDLETVHPTFPALEIAREFFLPAEHDWIAAGPIERFFHLWTAKEALMKATGLGMSLPPDKIRVNLQDDHPVTVSNLQTGTTHPVQTYPGPGNTIVATVHLPEFNNFDG